MTADNALQSERALPKSLSVVLALVAGEYLRVSAGRPNNIVSEHSTVRSVSDDRKAWGLNEGDKRGDALSAPHEEPFIFRAIKVDAATHEVGVCIFDRIQSRAHSDEVEGDKATIPKVFMQKLASALLGVEAA